MKVRHVLLLLLLVLPLVPVSTGQTVSDKYVIVFDQSHKQYFTPEMMKTALDSLSVLEERFNTEIVIVPLNSSFNSTNLQGADLVIITNPGKGSTVSIAEQRVLTNFVNKGGSTLYMGNPYSSNENITGNPDPLNDFMEAPSQTKASFQTAPDSTDKPTVAVDDFSNDGNETHIILKSNSLSDEVMYKDPGFVNVSEILYYGTGILDRDAVYTQYSSTVHGNLSETTYLVDEKYDLAVVSQKLYWLIGKSFGDGRTMAIGSTIMFSDLMYDNNTKWIEQKDNLQLFQNMIAWLLGLTPIKKATPIIEQEFGFFLTFDIAVAVVSSLLVATVVFGVLVYQGRISISDIKSIGLDRTKLRKGVSSKSHSGTHIQPKQKKQKKRKSAK